MPGRCTGSCKNRPVDELTRRHLRITGRVQGVFFRDWLREHAERADVRGWVRNCPDGTVEAVLEGRPAAVEKVVSFARSGPPHARVDGVEVSEEPHEGLAGFAVR